LEKKIEHKKLGARELRICCCNKGVEFEQAFVSMGF
jgi:hypothetical protein